VVKWRDKTSSVGTLVDDRAARVAVQLDTGMTTYNRRHVDVNGVRHTHPGQVAVSVLVETFLFAQKSSSITSHISDAPLSIEIRLVTFGGRVSAYADPLLRTIV